MHPKEKNRIIKNIEDKIKNTDSETIKIALRTKLDYLRKDKPVLK